MRPVTALVLLLLANVDDVIAKDAGHLGAQNTVGDVLRHPAFAGFGRLILPWDDRAYDEERGLSRIASLLPYHSHVIRMSVAGALNRMIDDVNRRQDHLLSTSTPRRRSGQSQRNEHGLFFFRGRPERRLPLSPQVAGSPMWAPSTKAFPMRWRSAGRDTTPSS